MTRKWLSLHVLFVLWISLLPESNALCSSRELEAYTSGSLTYRSYGYSYYSKGEYGGYDKNQFCEVLFKASYPKDVIELEVVDNDMQDRYRNQCQDKVILYDGPTKSSPVLKIFCGQEKPTVQSTSDKVLLIFETDDHDSRNYRGFKLKYSSIDRGGYEAYRAESSAISTGTIIASVIPSILVYGIIMLVVYKRCKDAQQVRRNLAATGHTPEDLRVAMATMIEQANRGPLPAAGRGPVGLQQNLMTYMDQSAAARTGRSTSERPTGVQRGRVRHPAGDIRTGASGNSSQDIPMIISDNDQTTPFLDHDGSDQLNGYAQPSNNNITTNNNTAANLNYQGYPGYPADPTGVYYAGNVDEHGMLHPADGGTPYYPPPGSIPTSLPSTVIANMPHLDIEDDRRSRSSSRRSHHGSERNSPRGRNSPNHSHSGHRSRASSTGHRSTHLAPHRHARGHHSSLNQLNQDGSTLKYYGMVDGDRSGSGDIGSTASYSDIPPSEQELPPPSYEEAASGKYSPNPDS